MKGFHIAKYKMIDTAILYNWQYHSVRKYEEERKDVYAGTLLSEIKAGCQIRETEGALFVHKISMPFWLVIRFSYIYTYIWHCP